MQERQIMHGQLQPTDKVKGCLFIVVEIGYTNTARYRCKILSPHSGEIVDESRMLTREDVFPWLDDRRDY